MAITPPATAKGGWMQVTWREVIVAFPDFGSKPRTVTVTVPAGKIQVTARDRATGSEFTCTVDVAAGDTAEVQFDSEDL